MWSDVPYECYLPFHISWREARATSEHARSTCEEASIYKVNSSNNTNKWLILWRK